MRCAMKRQQITYAADPRHVGVVAALAMRDAMERAKAEDKTKFATWAVAGRMARQAQGRGE